MSRTSILARSVASCALLVLVTSTASAHGFHAGGGSGFRASVARVRPAPAPFRPLVRKGSGLSGKIDAAGPPGRNWPGRNGGGTQAAGNATVTTAHLPTPVVGQNGGTTVVGQNGGTTVVGQNGGTTVVGRNWPGRNGGATQATSTGITVSTDRATSQQNNFGTVGTSGVAQGVNQPGQGATQAGIDWPAGYNQAQKSEALKLDNELTTAMTDFQADLGCYNEEIQLVQMELKNMVQQLESPSCDANCADQLASQIQELGAFLTQLQGSESQTIWYWEIVFSKIVGSSYYIISPSWAQAFIAANPGLGGALGAAAVQSIINQLTTAEAGMYSYGIAEQILGGDPLIPGCNAWQYEPM